jgi:hypothetical protein
MASSGMPASVQVAERVFEPLRELEHVDEAVV